MTIELVKAPKAVADPLEALERAAGDLAVNIERVDSFELHLAVPGLWRDAGFWFTWRAELATLQMGAPLEIKVPAARIADAARLLALVNERLWVGHFDLWSDDRSVVFRHSCILPANGALDAEQARRLIGGAREAIDRFLPAFNFLIWGGKSPEEALAASLFETVGSA